MAFEQLLKAPCVRRRGSLLWERNINIAMKNDNESGLLGEVEYAVKRRRFLEARDAAGDLGRDELLMYRELADAGKNTGESLHCALDVIRGVHVRRVKARYHRVEACLFFLVQRPVGHRYISVGKRIVIERHIRN